MRKTKSLYLHEEVLLLALRDREGTVASGSMFTYAMGGAVLSELLLRERVAVDESSKKKLLNVIDSSPIGDPPLDDCLNRMATAKRRANMQGWVSKFANTRGFKEWVAKGLCRRGILKADEDTVLLFFKQKIYPEINSVPERAIIERLRRAIFTDTSDIDARTLVLVSLANSSGLLNMVFEKRDLKNRKARLKKLAAEQPAGKATAQAIAAVQAALIASMIMTTTVIHSR